jgi:hypothetical protein
MFHVKHRRWLATQIRTDSSERWFGPGARSNGLVLEHALEVICRSAPGIDAPNGGRSPQVRSSTWNIGDRCLPGSEQTRLNGSVPEHALTGLVLEQTLEVIRRSAPAIDVPNGGRSPGCST